MSSAKLLALPLASLVIGTGLTYLAAVHAPVGSVVKIADACHTPTRANLLLQRDYVTGIPALDHVSCLLVGSFRRVLSDKLGTGIYALVWSVTLPLLVRTLYVAISPNHRTFWHSAALGSLLWSLALVLGVGLVPGSLLLTAYVLGLRSIVTSPSFATRPPVATPPSAVYGVNAAVFVTLATVGGVFYLESSSREWLWSFAASRASGVLAVLPLVLLGLQGTPAKPRDEREARALLAETGADEIAYDFMRTWGYYRQTALISAFFYWFGLQRVIVGLWSRGERLNDASFTLALDAAGCAINVLLMVAAEKLTVRSRADVHPVLGTPRPALAVERDAAIARAPAGNVSIETRLLPALLAGAVAGPGCVASLHWARGEEEAGWTGRRAWRETMGTKVAKRE